MKKTTIGVIGFGRFSQLMIRYLSDDFAVTVYDRQNRTGAVARLGGVTGSLADVCRRDIVIPAVPISVMPAMLSQMAPLLGPDAVVADVCSVKTVPVQWMVDRLPAGVSILGTHPMFGPDSAADTLAGHKVVLCRQRIDGDRYAGIRDYLAARGLVVIETTPEIHDRQIADSLALTHFIGRSLAEYGARPLEIDTEGYRRLLHTLETVTHDTWELFVDMHTYNPFARAARDRFREAVARTTAQLQTASRKRPQ